MSIIYEVNLEVDSALLPEYRRWLTQHIEDMVSLEGFIDAVCFAVLEPSAPERTGFCVHYRLQDQDALDHYMAHHAERMRADGLARFGDRVSASRRVLRAD